MQRFLSRLLRLFFTLYFCLDICQANVLKKESSQKIHTSIFPTFQALNVQSMLNSHLLFKFIPIRKRVAQDILERICNSKESQHDYDDVRWQRLIRSRHLPSLINTLLPELSKLELENSFSSRMKSLLALADHLGRSGNVIRIHKTQAQLWNAFQETDKTMVIATEEQRVAYRQNVLYVLGQLCQHSPNGRVELSRYFENYILHGNDIDWSNTIHRTHKMELTSAARWPILQDRMPTLSNILNDAQKTARLLVVLGVLRHLHPFDLANQDPLPPIAYAQKHGIEYQIGEFKIVPISESFRRHIFYTENHGNVYALELKVPGEKREKDHISPFHYTLADLLANSHPNDSHVAPPILFWRLRGPYFIYGKKLEGYGMGGLVAFEYKDGKRIQNSNADYVAYVSQRTGIPIEVLYQRIKIETAAASIRLHDLGYFNSIANEEDEILDSDAHNENVKLCIDGNVLLVGDFAVAEKPVVMNLKRRQEEVYNFLGLGHRGMGYANIFPLKLLPEVIKRLIQHEPSTMRRVSLALRTIEELRLTSGREALINALNTLATGSSIKDLSLSGIDSHIIETVLNAVSILPIDHSIPRLSAA